MSAINKITQKDVEVKTIEVIDVHDDDDHFMIVVFRPVCQQLVQPCSLFKKISFVYV